MMPPLRRTLLLTALLAGASLTAACTTTPPTPVQTSSDPTPSSAPSETTNVDGPLALLTTVPLSEEDHFILRFGDVDAIAAANDMERPAPDDIDGLIAWSYADTGIRVPAFVPEHLAPRHMQRHAEFRDELGFGAWDVQQFLSVESPPDRFTALVGTFDTKTLAATLGDANDGMWSLGGDDFATELANATAARSLGESLRLALVQDDLLLMSATTPALRAVLDDPGASMADDGSVAVVAAELIARDVISGVIVRDAFSGRVGLPAAFDTVAIGYSVGADGNLVITLVYPQSSSADAAANAEAIETLLAEGTTSDGKPYTDLLALDEIQVVDTSVVVTLQLTEGTHTWIPYQLMERREALFLTTG